MAIKTKLSLSLFLLDLDASVAFMNINQGAMTAPYYNSKSTVLVMVVEGSGRFEIARPHVASQSRGSQERGPVHYQKVSAKFSVGDAFVIPAGHPVVILASDSQNLQLVGFEINANNNRKNFLAGRYNIWNGVETEAKELVVPQFTRERERSDFEEPKGVSFCVWTQTAPGERGRGSPNAVFILQFWISEAAFSRPACNVIVF